MKLGDLIDMEDVVLLLRGAIIAALGILALFAVAIAAGIALQLFELTRGIG